jgi:circadian locomoter output cycles kaput protein
MSSQMQQPHHQSQTIHTHQNTSLGMDDQRTPHPIPQIVTSTFIEPPQYLTAISLQQVNSNNTFPGVTNIAHIPQNTEYLPASLIMTPEQNQIQDNLQRKHEELQHLIVQQQDELRRVSEQLLMARYGLLPYTSTENGTQGMRAIVSGLEVENQQQQQQICVSSELIHLQTQQLNSQENPNPSIEQVQLGQEMISYMQLTPVPTSHLLQPTPQSLSHHSTSPQHQRQQQQHHSNQLQHHEQHHQQMLPTGSHQNLETIPYQMSQDQVTTILYSNNIHSPGSTSSMNNNN